MLPEQRSEQWLELRNKMVTASTCADILGRHKNMLDILFERCKELNHIELKLCTGFLSKHKLRLQKRGDLPTDPPNQMMQRGAWEEHLLRQHCERIHFIQNVGDLYMPLKCRILHGWLLASPDGAMLDPLRLVEFKCLQRRQAEPGKIPHRYYIQCQLQMHVYQHPFCEYLEGRIHYFDNFIDWTFADHEHKYISYHEKHSPDLEITCPLNKTTREWHDEILIQTPGERVITYYSVIDSQSITIHYDRDWCESVLPELHTFYRSLFTAPFQNADEIDELLATVLE